MSFLKPVGNVPRRIVTSGKKACVTPETEKTIFRPGDSNFPTTVWTLHGDVINNIFSDFQGQVASMLRENFVNSVVIYADKIFAGFSKSTFARHFIVSL